MCQIIPLMEWTHELIFTFIDSDNTDVKKIPFISFCEEFNHLLTTNFIKNIDYSDEKGSHWKSRPLSLMTCELCLFNHSSNKKLWKILETMVFDGGEFEVDNLICWFDGAS